MLDVVKTNKVIPDLFPATKCHPTVNFKDFKNINRLSSFFHCNAVHTCAQIISFSDNSTNTKADKETHWPLTCTSGLRVTCMPSVWTLRWTYLRNVSAVRRASVQAYNKILLYCGKISTIKTRKHQQIVSKFTILHSWIKSESYDKVIIIQIYLLKFQFQCLLGILTVRNQNHE